MIQGGTMLHATEYRRRKVRRNAQERRDGTALRQMTTRLPAGLYRAVRLHCVDTGEPICRFVAAALSARLYEMGAEVPG
jgi:hypothetical protein